MTHISDILNEKDLEMECASGYVLERRHPRLPLYLYNYTKSAQYDQRWNDVTRQTRGLIVDFQGNIIARPFPKFFNYGESHADTIHLNDTVEAYDKIDGSLGILYPDPSQRHGYAVATRGSFTSDQAKWATRWFNEQEESLWQAWVGYDRTPLFEIVYPDNRIVLDYGDREGLVYLGSIEIPTGNFVTDDECWYGEHADVVFWNVSFREVLLADPRPNSEGYVVRSLDSERVVKVKQDDYVALHRLISGLNERSVFEALRSGADTYDSFYRSVPEEFRQFVSVVALNLTEEYLYFTAQYSNRLSLLLRHFNIDFEELGSIARRDLAAYINPPPNMGWEAWPSWVGAVLWADVDGYNTSGIFWKQVELNMKERNKQNVARNA